jgi:hypothetical protein
MYRHKIPLGPGAVHPAAPRAPLVRFAAVAHATLLEAAGGLALRRDDGAGRLRLAWRGAADWLGPLDAGLFDAGARHALALRPRPAPAGADDLGPFEAVELEHDALPLRLTLRAYRERPLFVFRSEALRDLEGLATGALVEPRLAFPWLRPTERAPGGAPAGLGSFGHQLAEFAYPGHGDGEFRGFVLAPHRPRSLLPLAALAPAGALLLAPLDAFHEQVAGVPAAGSDGAEGVRLGWHGDLARVPAGFASELALFAGDGVRELLEAWGALLQARAGTRRRGRYADPVVGSLSYWTDNGAVYYYRTAPGCDYTETLGRALDDLAAAEVPIRSLQLDSWFYPHAELRSVSPEGAPVVPPTGMLRWEPRDDLFPEGLAPLRRRSGGLPLTVHSRHFAARSPYFEHHEAWTDGAQAHPRDPALFERMLESAAGWGAVTYEQDWLVESFLGVRGLREAPGRAAAWQRALDAAAARRGLSLQWCMASPADFAESVHLGELGSIRTSGDYRYLFDNALNWVWFLHGNALARALGLWPFKDVFLSHDKTPEGFGDPLGEAEALLAALSAGPVGIGDQTGHTRRELVLRTCRPDGVLVKPDVPLAALERCYRAHGYFAAEPMVGEASSAHPAGRAVYVVTMNASHASKKSGEPLAVRVRFEELGAARPEGPVAVYDWRRGSFELQPADGGFEETLAYQDFGYRVLCPLLPGEVAVFGDVSKFATLGDRRVAQLRAVEGEVAFNLLGAPGELVAVEGFAARAPRGARAWSPAAGTAPVELAYEGAARRWRLRVPLDSTGQASVTLSWS